MPKKSSGSFLGADCRDQRGAALMIVLVVLVGLTVLGAAGLTMTGVEIRHSENVEASTEAFYAADAGLQQYMGSNANGSSADTFTVGESTVIVTPTLMSNLSGGDLWPRTPPGRALRRAAQSAPWVSMWYTPVHRLP